MTNRTEELTKSLGGISLRLLSSGLQIKALELLVCQSNLLGITVISSTIKSSDIAQAGESRTEIWRERGAPPCPPIAASKSMFSGAFSLLWCDIVSGGGNVEVEKGRCGLWIEVGVWIRMR